MLQNLVDFYIYFARTTTEQRSDLFQVIFNLASLLKLGECIDPICLVQWIPPACLGIQIVNILLMNIRRFLIVALSTTLCFLLPVLMLVPSIVSHHCPNLLFINALLF